MTTTVKKSLTWRSADGSIKPIDQLDLQHAQNIIKKIMTANNLTEASIRDFTPKIPMPKDYLSIAEMAQQFNESMHGDEDCCDATESDIY